MTRSKIRSVAACLRRIGEFGGLAGLGRCCCFGPRASSTRRRVSEATRSSGRQIAARGNTARLTVLENYQKELQSCGYHSDPSQIVYVLTNPAMLGLVKIGKTTQLEVEDRMKQLFSTGVPVPFDCAFACQVKDAAEVERSLHFAFGDHRINPNREFFKIEAERVIAVLKLLKVEDITAQLEQTLEADVTAADKQSAQNLKDARRPRMNFHELGVPTGSVLLFKDGQSQAVVVSDKKVELQGAVCSLTAATRKLLGLPDDYPLQPSPHWSFNGQSLKALYGAVHDGAE